MNYLIIIFILCVAKSIKEVNGSKAAKTENDEVKSEHGKSEHGKSEHGKSEHTDEKQGESDGKPEEGTDDNSEDDNSTETTVSTIASIITTIKLGSENKTKSSKTGNNTKNNITINETNNTEIIKNKTTIKLNGTKEEVIISKNITNNKLSNNNNTIDIKENKIKNITKTKSSNKTETTVHHRNHTTVITNHVNVTITTTIKTTPFQIMRATSPSAVTVSAKALYTYTAIKSSTESKTHDDKNTKKTTFTIFKTSETHKSGVTQTPQTIKAYSISNVKNNQINNNKSVNIVTTKNPNKSIQTSKPIFILQSTESKKSTKNIIVKGKSNNNTKTVTTTQTLKTFSIFHIDQTTQKTTKITMFKITKVSKPPNVTVQVLKTVTVSSTIVKSTVKSPKVKGVKNSSDVEVIVVNNNKNNTTVIK